MNDEKAGWAFQKSSLERSFVWSLLITSLPALSGFVVSWVIARWAGASVLGTVAWVMSLATAVLIVAKLGLDLSASRLASEFGVNQPGNLRPLFKKALGFRFLSTMVVAILMYVAADPVARVLDDLRLVWPIRIGALVVICASFYEFNENFVVGLNRLRTVYKVRSLHLLLRIIFTIGIVFLGLGAAHVLAGYAGAWIIAITVYWVLLARFLPPANAEGDSAAMTRRLLALSAALAVSSASVTIYSHMDRLMLGYFVGVGEVGQYAVARNISEIALFPVFAMVMMLRPALASRYASGETNACTEIIRMSLRTSLLLGVFFAALFAVLGESLVIFIFSEEFTYSGGLMIYLVGVVFLRSLGAVLLPALIAADRTKLYAYLTTVSAIVNFGLNVWWIPQYQARGAILATIVSYGLLLILGLRELTRSYSIRMTWSGVLTLVRTIFAGAISAGIVWWLMDRTGDAVHVAGWAVVLFILYLASTFAVHATSSSEIRAFMDNLRKSNS